MPDRPALEPQRTALLMMDYQSGIIAQLPDHEQLLDRVSSAIGGVRSRAGHVGWVRVAFEDEEFDAIPETSVFAAMTSAQRRPWLRNDAAETQIHARLAPQPADVVVRKTRVGAFSTTDLDRQLRDRGVDTLVLGGVSTSGVVLSTVREAMDRDYRIVVLSDACADRDLDAHRFLTEKLFLVHTHVAAVGELDSLWA